MSPTQVYLSRVFFLRAVSNHMNQQWRKEDPPVPAHLRPELFYAEGQTALI